MHIEVDQSGKIEQFNEHTFIAFSDDVQFCVKLPKQVKQQLSLDYKSTVKNLRYRLFAIMVFICIKPFLLKNERIVIDCEYEGKEPLIKALLLGMIRNSFPSFDKRLLSFGRIGKLSRAHAVAIDTYREHRKPNKIVSYEEIVQFLKK